MFRRIRQRWIERIDRAQAGERGLTPRVPEEHGVARAASDLMRRPATGLALAVAVFGVVACSGSESSTTTLAPTPNAGTAAPSAGGAGGASVPGGGADDPQQNRTGFDAYTYLGTVERSVIFRIDLDVAKCLSGQGFDWTPEPNGDRAAFEAMVHDTLRPPSMDEIRQFGYAYKLGRLQQLGDASAEEEAALSPALLEAKEACTTRVVTGSAYERWLVLSGQVQDAVAGAEERVRSHPDFVAVEQQWSSCVAQAGYQLTHLDDGADVEWPSDDDPEAIDMAVSDYQCRFDVGIFDVEARLLNEEANAWREANPALVAEMDALRTKLTAYGGG